MTITVTFTPQRTVRVVCGDESIEVALPDALPRPPVASAGVVPGAVLATTPAPDAPRRPVRPPVIGVVQPDDVRTTLGAEAYARVLGQAVAASPVRLDDVEDFNVTNLSMRALEDDVRDDADADEPLVLDVFVDPSGLDHAIALERLRRIVNDRSNPIDAIRLLGLIESA